MSKPDFYYPDAISQTGSVICWVDDEVGRVCHFELFRVLELIDSVDARSWADAFARAADWLESDRHGNHAWRKDR